MRRPVLLMTRSINGILLLDKPGGLTSNRVLQIVKRLYGAEKAGHTGSLDPLATGMLPICLGQATKMSRYLLAADKRYQVVAQLGVATSTADADGEVTATADVPELSRQTVEVALAGFGGELEQTPPMYSALKHKGRRLYTLARRGEDVPRPTRRVVVTRIELQAYQDARLSFTVTCSKGTYVRSLVEDLGRALGTLAHVVALRRLAVEPFVREPMYTLAALEKSAQAGLPALDELLLAVDRGIDHWPRLDLPQGVCVRLAQGQRIAAQPDWPEAPVRVYSPADGFIGIAEIVAGELAPRRIFHSLGGSR